MGEPALRLRLQLVFPSGRRARVLLRSKTEMALPVVRLNQNDGDFQSEGDTADQAAVEGEREDGAARDVGSHVLRYVLDDQGEVAVFAFDNELGEDIGDVGIRFRHRDSGCQIPAVPSNSAGDAGVDANVGSATHGVTVITGRSC